MCRHFAAPDFDGCPIPSDTPESPEKPDDYLPVRQDKLETGGGDKPDKVKKYYVNGVDVSVIGMNPPYGGTEQRSVQSNFPAEMRSSETADLFMALATYRLKRGGRAAVIIPDGFLFGTDGSKAAIKKRLLDEFNLHTIVRLPSSVFSPYTSITTNILFFDSTGRTKNTWFYRVDMPMGYKHFSKTKPMLFEHFADCAAWWDDRHEIRDEGTDTFKSRAYSAEELAGRGYDFDLCGYPTASEEILSPEETIRAFRERRAQLNAKIDRQIDKIAALLEGRSC